METYSKVKGDLRAWFIDPGEEACLFVRGELVGEGSAGD